MGVFNKQIIIGGISAKDKLMLVRQLHAGIRAGYSLVESLQLAYSQSSGRLTAILKDVIRRVEKGSYLHEAFQVHGRYFSPLFISLIKTGELSSSLEQNLQRLYVILEKEREFRQKVRSAMTYPTFVLVAVFGLGLAVAFFILPNLVPLFKSLDTELPVSTRILLWFAEAFELYGAYIFWGFVVLVLLLFWLGRQRFSRPVTHYLVLRFPLLGSLYRKIIAARFARTMESLLGSGLPIDHSLELAASIITNHYYQKAIMSWIPLVRKGAAFSDAVARHAPFLFENLFVRMLALGEKTGNLESAFSHIAEFYEEDTDLMMKNLAISLEPALLIFVGLIVGFTAMAILGPIYSLSGAIR